MPPGARLRAIGERLKQIGQFGVAVLRLEPLHVVAAAPIARRADDGELRRAEVRQCECAASRHPLRIAENLGTAKDQQAQASSLITANPN